MQNIEYRKIIMASTHFKKRYNPASEMRIQIFGCKHT